jgi:hypothetical protein
MLNTVFEPGSGSRNSLMTPMCPSSSDEEGGPGSGGGGEEMGEEELDEIEVEALPAVKKAEWC